MSQIRDGRLHRLALRRVSDTGCRHPSTPSSGVVGDGGEEITVLGLLGKAGIEPGRSDSDRGRAYKHRSHCQSARFLGLVVLDKALVCSPGLTSERSTWLSTSVPPFQVSRSVSRGRGAWVAASPRGRGYPAAPPSPGLHPVLPGLARRECRLESLSAKTEAESGRGRLGRNDYEPATLPPQET